MTTRPDHAAEARRLLTLVRPTALTQAELPEFYAYETPANVIAAAAVHVALAQLEEQRTANLIALFREDGPEVIRADYTGMTPEEKRRASAQVRAQYLTVADDVARRVGIA